MAVTNLAEQERLLKEAEERQKRKYERSKGTNNNEAKAITRTYRTEDVDREENQGGFFGGAAYLGEKLAAGFVQSIEGMADYIGGGFLKFLGDVTGNVDLQDQAYDIFNEQWWNGDFYRHADEWYNPSGGMKVAGDIAGGIGTSLPAIAGATIATVASHGAAAPAAWAKAAPVIGAAFAGVGAAGNATSEAVQETGSLDWSKLGYGAMVGATEAGVERLTAGIGAGSGRILKELAQTGMGKAVSQFTKKGLVNIAKQVGKDFAAEAAEEMIAEFTAPIYKRMTYDTNAKMASAEQIAYAGFVGGMSGVIMSGGQSMVNTGRNSVVGKQIIRNGEVDRVLAMGKRLSEFKSANPDIESETLNAAVETYEKLSASKAKDANFFRNRYQANKLGELAMLDTAVTFEMYAAQRAYDIAMNADAFVEKASAYKYVDPDGNPITVTKDELLKGVKVGKDGSIDRKSLVKAIRTNRTLQYFALMDVAGHMAMDTSAFTEASKQGQGVATDLDLARYLETASDTEKSSLARALGVDGVAGLEALSADEFNSRVAWRNENSARVKDLNSIAQIADSVKDVAAEGAIPSRFRRRNDGTYLYESDGNKIAIVKQGDSYGVYDYKTGKVASKLTKGELDQMLKDYNERHGRRESADATTETKTATKAETADTKNAEVEAFANERVKGYSKLLPAEQTLVRRVIRQGRTMGVRDDILSAYANVCAHAKILVQFRKGVGMEVKTASGEVVKSNGYYDDARNVIVANPDAANGIDHVLIHELDHAIRTSEPKRGKAGKAKTFSEAIKGVAEDVKANIKATYGKDVETIKDEINAYYAETVLSAEATVERLVADRPSLKDKILGFFKAAKADYKDVPFLDKAAESYYQKYKKMFDKFAKRNAGGLISSVSERNVRAIRPSNALGVKHNLAFVETHRKKLENNYNGYDLKEYDLAVEMFKGISEELDSAFLSEWNDKDGKRKPFKVFKDQMGYKHNVELSTECVKGVALFEAIDSIVQKQISKTVGDAGIHTAEKQLLYDLLQKRGFQIPCAICYVEQARQREGKIIENFLDGNEEKLGWNQTIDKIEKLMAADGHAYTFGNFNRMLATDAYSPAKAADMTDEQFEAFNKAFRTLANEYIDRENERRAQTNKKLLPRINSVTPSSVSKSLPATANLDIKLLRTFFLDPSLRMRIADDLLYSSLTTLNLATHHQKLYALFNQQGGQQTYKLKQAPIVYWGEILGKKKTPKDIRTEGSFRIQSNSDFQLYSFLDYVQMFVDLSAKGYSLHAYTKTLTQLKLFGLSGGKINASLIPRVKVYYDADGNVNEAKTMENAGLDESGNPIYDDVEGIPHEETFMLLEDPEYSKNCTGICIGYSDKHILKLLDDPHVQLIIGFHDTTNDTSKRYRGAKYSTNYNGFNEAVKVVSKDKFETVHLSFNEFVMQAEAALGYNVDTRKAAKESIEYNGKTYKVDDIPRLAVAMYLQYCSDHNMLPAYSRTGIDFSKHPNYYKLLGDYGLYDSQGHYAPQGAVSYKLPSKVPYLDANGKKAYQSTKAYLKEHLQGELAVRDSLAATLAEEGEGSFMDEYTKGAKAIRENGGRYAPKVEPQVNAPTITTAPAGAKQSLPLSATKAVETFGTTSDVTKAGFVLPDGQMLNFERNGGVRHDRIAEVYDGVKGDAAVNAFIQEGNVRIKATAPGIELSSEHMPTVPQRNALNRFISRMLREKGRFYVDITDVNGRDVNTFEYDSEATAEDVMWDLRGYYGAEATVAPSGVKFSLPLGTTDSTFDPRAVLDKGTPRATGKANMTVAQLARVLANNTRMKVFSRQEALKIVNNFSASDLLTEKTRNELATQVWTLLNDAPDPDYREASIRNMAEFIAARIMTEAKYDNRNPDAVEDASYTVSNLHTYVQRVTFSDAYRQEIKSKVGEDGWRSIVSRWGLKKRFGAGTPMDVAMWDIVSEVKGFEGLEEMHPADAFIEIDKRYREALSDLQKDDITLWETMDDAQAEAFVEGIARDIRDAFENGGSKSKLANILNNNIGYYKARAEKLRSELVEQNQFQRAVNDIQYLCDRLKNIKAGALDNATQNKDHPFAATLESLANVKWRGRMLSPKTIREHLTQLHFWYVSDTTKKILGYKSEEDTGMYSQYIADVMAKIAAPAPRESTSLKTDNTPFTAYDLERIKEVISHAIAISENYNKVWKNGKMVDALPEAEKYIETMQKSLSVKVNATWEKVYSGYLWQFGTPVDVMAHADKFMEGGFFSEMLQTLRDAAENAAIEEMNVLKEHDAFIDKHKHYVRESTETKVKFRGQEIPKQTLITLYMTAKREHAWAGLVFNGAQYKLGNLEVKVKPLTTAEELTYGEMQSLMAQAQEEMAALLTETDKEYIAILEKGYNLTLKEIKIKRDMERMGFTNAMDGYYVPLKRANMATTIDQQFLPINTASNSSFNKNTVRGAAQALELVAAEDLFLRHAHEVCQYAYLSPAIESFDVLWNIDTAGNRNNPTSLKTVYHAANPDVVADRKSEKRENAKRGDMEGYFRELIQDIQGTKRGDSNEWISAIRGGYATFQLGANPKVWMTQLSSIFASLSELDAQSIFGIGGINFFSPAGSDVDLYCPLAELRNYNNDAASAQAVMDMRTNRASEGLQKVRDVSMTMIGKMDRLVVMKVFIACQKHVAKHQGLEYGTEANKIAAGKLLKTVIENTQQGSLATEKSKAARGGEIMKTFTMFRSDAIKVMGRVLTSAGNLAVKIQVAKSMKANPNAYSKEQIAKAEADVKAAGMKFGKSMAALVSVSAFMTFVSWLFRHLYNKDEDKPEEELIKTAITFGGSFLGGLPIISDIYSSVVEGFAIENFALGAANDLVEAIKGVGTLIVNSAQGKASSQDWMRGTRDIVYAVCSIMGLPVRNVWNTVSGLIRRVNSGAGKAIDNVFYGTYASEFKEAIEAGDDSKAYMIMQILTGDRLDGADSAVVNGFHSLNQRLLKQNKDIILPADCPASITVGGKKIEFTTAEQSKIQQRFASKAESDFKKLFASEAYKSMTAAQKRAAVAAINSARLHECIEYATNKDTGDSNILGAKAVTFSTFAQYKGIINGIESDKDKDGNTISGSKRAKVVTAIKKLKVSDEQKLFLIMVSGYSVKAGDFAGISEKSAKKRVASFIAGLSSLTKAEKEELAKKCGFEVKNGVIQTK